MHAMLLPKMPRFRMLLVEEETRLLIAEALLATADRISQVLTNQSPFMRFMMRSPRPKSPRCSAVRYSRCSRPPAPPPSLMLPSVLASQGLPIDANKSIQKATRDVLKDNTRKSLVAK